MKSTKVQKKGRRLFRLIFILFSIFAICYFNNNGSLEQIINNKFEVNTQNVYPWNLTLVNKWNKIPKNYEVELTTLYNGEAVDSRIYPALQEMFDSARHDGVYPVVISSYRTREVQQFLLDDKIRSYEIEGYSEKNARELAEKWVAVPDTSEHQLGISVDINADKSHSTNEQVYNWLDQNAYKYGFIYRYPENKTDVTGIINEPWHYRYVGVEASTDIHNQGICLEEYLDNTNKY